MNCQQRPRVIVIGAGFGGLQAVQTLGNKPVEVIWIDRNNYHTFTPLLHQVATAELEPEQIAYPIRRLLRQLSNVQFCMAEVQGIDVDQRVVDLGNTQLTYDFLVIATGSAVHYHNVPGAADYAFALKTLPQAIALRQHIVSCLEQAAQTVDELERQQLLTFTIVGGGATGVEVAGSLAEFVRSSLRLDYPELSAQSVQIVLIHTGDRVFSQLAPQLSNHLQRALRQQGVTVLLNTKVTAVTAAAIQFNSEQSILTRTIIWAAGVQANQLQHWGFSGHSMGLVQVLPSLSVPKHSQVYLLGDSAAFQQNEQWLPQLAPVAMAQGKAAAQNILRQLRGQRPLPFRYVHKGTMAIVGRSAVAQIGPLRITGFAAWLLWLMLHLGLLPSTRDRLLTLLQWIWVYGLRRRTTALIKGNDNYPAIIATNTRSDRAAIR
jgi:NADH:ubiquinone reductase (H+-translocating)